MALECLACEHQGAVEAAVEFFDLMNAVPVEQRHPQLGPPVYASALPCLTRQARYPLPFSSWEESEQDSESFYSFRYILAGTVVMHIATVDDPCL